jgi:hypothetical protein
LSVDTDTENFVGSVVVVSEVLVSRISHSFSELFDYFEDIVRVGLGSVDLRRCLLVVGFVHALVVAGVSRFSWYWYSMSSGRGAGS